MLDRWSSYAVMIVGEFAWADSALSIGHFRQVVVLHKWSFEQLCNTLS